MYRLEFLPCLLISFFPFLPNALQSIVFTIFILYSILVSFKTSKFSKRRLLYYFLFSGYYFFSLLTLLYNTTIPITTLNFQSNILIPIIGFVVIFLNFNIQKYRTIMFYGLIFSTTVFLINLYIYLDKGVDLYLKHYKDIIDLRHIDINNNFFFILKERYEYILSIAGWGYFANKIVIEINTHHTFISALINLIIIIAFKFFPNYKIIAKILFICLIALCSFAIWFFQSKVNIIFLAIFFFIALTSYIYSLPKLKNRMSRLNYSLIVCLAFILISFLSLNYIVQYKMPQSLIQIESFDTGRQDLYQNLIPIAFTKKWSGIGLNNVNLVVDSVMQKYKNSYDFNNPINLKHTHSQYLYYMLAGGLINFLLFIVFFIFLFYCFFKNHNYLGMAFVLLIMINCVFEDFLNRVFGVYILAFGMIYFWRIENDSSEYSIL